MKHCFDKQDYTIGDLINEIMAIDNENDARTFFADYCAWLTTSPTTKPYKSEEVARANIGWCFGEGMKLERRNMWINVCAASHPVFGQTVPTFDEALKAGMDWAKAK